MKRFFVGLVVALFFTGNVLSAAKVVDKTPTTDKTVTDKTLTDKTLAADKVLAVVNGEPILISEFNRIFEPIEKNISASNLKSELKDSILDQLSLDRIRDQILDQIIMSVILKQEATKQKIIASKREIKDKINEIKKMYKSGFDAKLKESNMTLSDLEKEIADQIIITKFIQRLLHTTDSETKKPSEIEAKSFYDEIVTKIKGGKTNLPEEEEMLAKRFAESIIRESKEHVRLIEIFISCPKGASTAKEKEVLNKIAVVKRELQKQEFDNVAVQYSEHVASKSRNGDMGLLVKEELPSAIREIAFSINVGDYTKEPIKADDGYYFLKVQEKTAKRNITFVNVKSSIIEGLHKAKAEKKNKEFIDKLKSKADIKKNKTW